MAAPDNNPQRLDRALIAGGEDMVGVANDMVTGPDTRGAPNVRESAASGHADGCRMPRE